MTLRWGFGGIICFQLLVQACGQYSETKIKDYTLHFYSQETVFQNAAQKLVTEYNRMAGIPVLSYVADEGSANSYVNFVQGLHSPNSDKLAYGQWVTETSEEPFTRSLEGHILQKVVNYSMNLEFDYNYFKARAVSADDTLEWKTIFVLFCHEVGHGLTMDDIYDPAQRLQIMYGYIIDQDIPSKDFTTYFDRVRSFLADK